MCSRRSHTFQWSCLQVSENQSASTMISSLSSNDLNNKLRARLFVAELLHIQDCQSTRSDSFNSTELAAQFTEEVLKTLRDKYKSLSATPSSNCFNRTCCVFIGVVFVCCCASLAYLYTFDMLDLKERCIVPTWTLPLELSRPIQPCEKICHHLSTNSEDIPNAHSNISQLEFLNRFAYSRIPVVVRGGCSHWKAKDTFSLTWFRHLYSRFPQAYALQEEFGEFFPYKFALQNLEDALSLSEERLREPWYFGWSNSVREVQQVLREQYERPPFLPSDGENVRDDWIFMGTPGYGAPFHVDFVRRASWQAQISGTKKWLLLPPAECSSVCRPQYSVTLQPGDILVLDTNFWFHATQVLPGNISIAIGSEFE